MSLHDPANTAFVFVGGVSHTPSFFDALAKEFKSRGFESLAFAYPTIGPDSQGKGLQDEYRSIQEVVGHFVEREKDVVLVGHSYGGWTASRAVKGWDVKTRRTQGKKHGIKELVFISGFCVPEGADMKMFSFLPPWIDIRVLFAQVTAMDTADKRARTVQTLVIGVVLPQANANQTKLAWPCYSMIFLKVRSVIGTSS